MREAAALLVEQGANPFRANAYRKAAEGIAQSKRSVRDIFESSGRAGLDALPGVGPGIAGAIAEILTSGRWIQLERLQGTSNPITTLQTIPSIGPQLAKCIHDELQVDTLEALETACHDGRLASVVGVGARRAAAICAAVASVLDQRRIVRRPLAGLTRPARPPIALLLDVDREYRQKAHADELPRIAPKRFNPDSQPWLPILHTSRGAWNFTALYSNTGRAHELNKTHDWVVIYAHTDRHPEQQCTVVTQTHGKLVGRRVVRGRESQCDRFYGAATSASPTLAAP
jgi:Holliday junction resolvasome RuvABC DNA-binding subunit